MRLPADTYPVTPLAGDAAALSASELIAVAVESAPMFDESIVICDQDAGAAAVRLPGASRTANGWLVVPSPVQPTAHATPPAIAMPFRELAGFGVGRASWYQVLPTMR